MLNGENPVVTFTDYERSNNYYIRANQIAMVVHPGEIDPISLFFKGFTTDKSVKNRVEIEKKIERFYNIRLGMKIEILNEYICQL